MGSILLPPITEVYICDPTGVRLECLDYVTEIEYLNDSGQPGPFMLKLPEKFSRAKCQLDNIIEIWLGYGPGTLKLDYCGFLQDWEFVNEGGLESTYLYGHSTMELLNRRIVKDYAESAQAKMTGNADDLIKAIAKDQLGSDTTAARDLTSVGGGFTIQANLSDAQSVTKAFAYKNVLEICQELSDTSAKAGTYLFFDVVPYVASTTTGALAFQLQTFTDQRGSDRTWDSSTPVFIGNEWGNLENPTLGFYNSASKNYVYVLGPGEGESRETTEVSNTSWMGQSIWNRREGSKDARNTASGDTAARTGEGNTYLWENRPYIKFTGNVVETPAFRYGRDWGFGDMVTVTAFGYQLDAMIDKVHRSVDEHGQHHVTAALEIYV